jgi:shikimate dehydrogenase
MSRKGLRLAIAGKPVLHSRSPDLHAAALASTGTLGFYTRLAADDAEDALALGRRLNLTGLTLTAPFKEDLARIVTRPAAEVTALGAANTVVFDGDETLGFNTDVFGAMESLRGIGADVTGHQILVLGSGGAARAVCYGLSLVGANAIVSSVEDAVGRALAHTYGFASVSWTKESLRAAAADCDIIVNATSCSEEIVPADALRPSHVVLDAIYAHETTLIRTARAVGARVIDGLPWLVHQGREAFRVFGGLDVSGQVLLDALSHTRAGSGRVEISGHESSSSIASLVAARLGAESFSCGACAAELRLGSGYARDFRVVLFDSATPTVSEDVKSADLIIPIRNDDLERASGRLAFELDYLR